MRHPRHSVSPAKNRSISGHTRLPPDRPRHSCPNDGHHAEAVVDRDDPVLRALLDRVDEQRFHIGRQSAQFGALPDGLPHASESTSHRVGPAGLG